MDDNFTVENDNDSRLPVEVCENVIDMLYSMDLQDQVEHSRALHSCALVCKAWRVRSQRNLFYSVVLQDTDALEKFAAVLDNGPHLSDYVHEVMLFEHITHTTAGPLSLFPVALYGKLPNLEEIAVKRIREARHWYHRAPNSATAKSIEHLALHPRFPLFLSAFTSVVGLYISNITFQHFNDFLATINALPALQRLLCDGLWCMALGPLPMYARPQTSSTHARAHTFAPHLLTLVLVRTL